MCSLPTAYRKLPEKDLKILMTALNLNTKGTIEQLHYRLEKCLNEPEPELSKTADTATLCENARKHGVIFNGQSTDAAVFLERLDLFQENFRIPLQTLLSILPMIFKDKALLWCRNQRHSWSNWQNFLDDFYLQYLPFRYHFKLQEAIKQHKQRRNEKFKEYATALLSLLRRCGSCSMVNKLDRIYDNMLPQYKMHIRRNTVSNLPELLTAAAKYEQNISEPVKLPTMYPSISRPPISRNTVVESVTVNCSKRPQEFSSTAIVPRNETNWTAEFIDDEITAESNTGPKCSQKEHSQVDCQSRPLLLCYKCGKNNIATQDCCGSQNQPILSQPAPVSPAINQSVTDSRPWLTVDVFGTAFKAIVNTAVKVTFMGPKLQQHCQMHGIPLAQDDLPVVHMADGSVSSVQGRMSIQATCLTAKHNISCLVLSATKEDIVIGMDVIQSLGMVIDSAAKQVYIQKPPPVQAAAKVQPLPASQMEENGSEFSLEEKRTVKPAKTGIPRSEQSEIPNPITAPVLKCSPCTLSDNTSSDSCKSQSADNTINPYYCNYPCYCNYPDSENVMLNPNGTPAVTEESNISESKNMVSNSADIPTATESSYITEPENMVSKPDGITAATEEICVPDSQDMVSRPTGATVATEESCVFEPMSDMVLPAYGNPADCEECYVSASVSVNHIAPPTASEPAVTESHCVPASEKNITMVNGENYTGLEEHCVNGSEQYTVPQSLSCAPEGDHPSIAKTAAHNRNRWYKYVKPVPYPSPCASKIMVIQLRVDYRHSGSVSPLYATDRRSINVSICSIKIPVPASQHDKDKLWKPPWLQLHNIVFTGASTKTGNWEFLKPSWPPPPANTSTPAAA